MTCTGGFGRDGRGCSAAGGDDDRLVGRDRKRREDGTKGAPAAVAAFGAVIGRSPGQRGPHGANVARGNEASCVRRNSH